MKTVKEINLLKTWFSKQPDYLFKNENLTIQTKERFIELGRIVRGDILTMTTVASSGHPGGPMSSADIFITVYSLANTHPSKIDDISRDRIVISHGHTSAGCYSILGRLGFFNIEDALTYFRKCGSIFEGHVERDVHGCEWTSGNLGQGLSAGCGFALASKINKKDYNVFVLMGDAEQAKGQVAEARRFAKKFKLTNLTVLIDYNELQISGSIHEIMDVNIEKNYLADGWKVIEIDGHNYEEIYNAIRESINDTSSTYAILCHTIMGKSVSFMENAREYYHGRPLSQNEYRKALQEIGIDDKLDSYKKRREKTSPPEVKSSAYFTPPVIETGEPIDYKVTDKLGNRDAFGKALENIVTINKKTKKSAPITALDCDLKESVRTHLIEKIAPEWFIEGGVQEHNTATIAGVLSIEGILTFFADFGVFGIDEVYNQQRLNAINHTNLKVVITHSGINVGKDGKTHHCIDFLGLGRNLPGFRIIIPADPNQTDRVIRYVSKEEGNFLVVTGRTKNPIITDSKGQPYFSRDYTFKFGEIDVIREGKNGVIMAYGPTLELAINSWEELREQGITMDIWNVSAPLAISLEDIEKAIFKSPIFTLEDHLVYSGLGTTVGNLIAETGMGTIFRKIGVRDFAPSGSTQALYSAMGIDSASLTNEVKRTVGSR